MFHAFAQLNDALAATTKKLEKRALISAYLTSVPVEDAGRAALWLSGTPFAETDPRVLNIGGSLLSQALAQLTAATPADLGAAYRRHGDLGAAAADLLAHAVQAAGRPANAILTLADVESAFSALAEARGPAAKLRLLLDLLARATPLEAKYLIKLATGDMRTGVRQSLVEEAIAQAWPLPPGNQPSTQSSPAAAPTAAEAVRRAGMLLGDLRAVVALAASQRLHEARMQLFHPLGFMLASPVQSIDEAFTRASEETIAEATAPSPQPIPVPHLWAPHPGVPAPGAPAPGAPGWADSSPTPHWQLEDKYDGIRAQLHVAPPTPAAPARVALYSRNREDLSAAFPELTEAFAALREPAILDGEILAWNPAAARALPFSALQQRLGRKRVSLEMRRNLPVVLVVFDILYRGTTLLLEEPLSARRRHLAEFAARWSPLTAATESRGQTTLFAPEEAAFPRLILAPATPLADASGRVPHSGKSAPDAPAPDAPGLASPTSAASQLERAYTDARARGNEGIMLKSLSSPYQPGRRGLAWLKLKRELATLDVVVTGVEYGNGRRAAVLSDYTFAVRDPGDPAQPLKNIGKAYSGLTDQEIAELTAWFKAHTLADNGHFRTVEPLLVIEVAFNNLMRSTRHNSGFALRFPRILRIRTDKPVEEIDTLARVEEIYHSQPDRPDPERSEG